MNETPAIVFRLSGKLYGVRAAQVREIIWLPELTALTEAPDYIAGVFNYRGRVIPVMDLNLVMGYAADRPYSLSDRVIVLENENALLGVVVHELDNVRQFDPDKIDPIEFGEATDRGRFLEGLIRDDDRIISLLRHESLFTNADLGRKAALKDLIGDQEDQDLDVDQALNDLLEERMNRVLPSFLKELSEAERAVFRGRASNLLQQEMAQDSSGHLALGIIQLNGENFGVELGAVMEFAELRQVTPVPCCPEHILGCMNLRGNILTLVDIRFPLGMSTANGMNATKVMVMKQDDRFLGAVIEDIYDVVYVNEGDVTEVPAALNSAAREFLRGAFPYQERISGIINISKIIAEGDLVVDLKP